MSFQKIFLASKSPRRQELLTQIGVDYELVSVDVEEQRQSNESPAEYVCRLSRDKAQAGALLNNSYPVLGADTIVVLGDDVLEKPEGEAQGINMLLRLAGNTHQVMTAISVVYQGECKTQLSITQVRFRSISEAEARDYYQTDEPYDKAGGYGIQGLGAIFVESIEGSYSGVVGLPLFETANLLKTLRNDNS